VIEDDSLAPSDVDDIYTDAEGTLRVDTLMEEPPPDEAGALRVLAHIEDNPVLRGKLASADGKVIAIFVPLEAKDRAHEIAGEIQAWIDAEGGEETYYLAGIPLAEDTFGTEMFKQMAISAPVAFLVIFLLMQLFFRNWRVVLAPMLVAMMSVTWTMGLLIGLGFTVHIMSSMIPIFLMPIAVLDSIHLLTEFHERYQQHRDVRRIVKDAIDELYVPMLYTSVTTMVGFASLVLAPIPPVQVFGVFVAFGIGVAWILSIVFNAAYVVLLPPRVMENFGVRDEAHGLLGNALRGIRRFAVARRVPLLIVGAVVFGISVVGVTRIVVNDNPVRWFRPGHELRVADEVMNEHLDGTYVNYLVLESDEPEGLKDPAAMQYVAALQDHLATHPNVGGTTSVADIVKKIRRELTQDPDAGIVPDSREEIAQYLFLYEISGGDPEDLFKLITPESDRANVWVQMPQGENQAVTGVVEAVTAFVAAHPPPGLSVQWAGLPFINVVWQQKMVAGMGKALAGSFVVVLIMMTLLFRSLRLGLLSMIPLSATIALVYGAIGFVGKPYDMPIAVLSSLTLGLSIDFAIHFLQRARELYEETGDVGRTLDLVFEAPARAIARNIVVIAIGFVPMFFAGLMPYVTVGAFFCAIMLVSGLTTLVTFPAVLSLGKSGYLAGRGGSKGGKDTPAVA